MLSTSHDYHEGHLMTVVMLPKIEKPMITPT